MGLDGFVGEKKNWKSRYDAPFFSFFISSISRFVSLCWQLTVVSRFGLSDIPTQYWQYWQYYLVLYSMFDWIEVWSSMFNGIGVWTKRVKASKKEHFPMWIMVDSIRINASEHEMLSVTGFWLFHHKSPVRFVQYSMARYLLFSRFNEAFFIGNPQIPIEADRGSVFFFPPLSQMSIPPHLSLSLTHLSFSVSLPLLWMESVRFCV